MVETSRKEFLMVKNSPFFHEIWRYFIFFGSLKEGPQNSDRAIGKPVKNCVDSRQKIPRKTPGADSIYCRKGEHRLLFPWFSWDFYSFSAEHLRFGKRFRLNRLQIRNQAAKLPRFRYFSKLSAEIFFSSKNPWGGLRGGCHAYYFSRQYRFQPIYH